MFDAKYLLENIIRHVLIYHRYKKGKITFVDILQQITGPCSSGE